MNSRPSNWPLSLCGVRREAYLRIQCYVGFDAATEPLEMRSMQVKPEAICQKFDDSERIYGESCRAHPLMQLFITY